ncbi:hypothetical protein J4573_04875 [Actinomadura barringtoniae]|uniref:Uncharacterized protein n=1 Tax=Actinomadura barringtoniae TaxID=1427535 RepID=A0A939P6I2_9ACTN|nr:hypothetical protein [Actinomadura barringtoniae]MBO2446411.1 hypothetical protein [Actinomadura barringtoniae]
MTDDLSDRIAAAAQACTGVEGLSAEGGKYVTYRAGTPVRGVVVGDGEITVCVVAATDRPVLETAEDVGAAVAPLADGRPVHVVVADVQDKPVRRVS